MSKSTEMEEKVQALLNECIGIVCELPVHDTKLVNEATSGKINAEDPGPEDVDHAKALIPTLRWLLDSEATKKPVKRRAKAPTDPKDAGENKSSEGEGEGNGNGGTKVRMKRGASKRPTEISPASTQEPPLQDELPV